MSDSDLILTLAKVLVAAAWADEEISHDEINALKDLLFHLPNLTARDWAELDIYTDSPIDQAERDRLIKELQAAIRTSQDKRLASETLEQLIRADGTVTEEERAIAAEIQSAIDAVNTHIFSRTGKMMRATMRRRAKAASEGPNREMYLDDFIRNRIYYKMRQRMDLGDAQLDLPDTDLRKLSLAGGLLSRVAHVDNTITKEEFSAMVDALRQGWDLPQDAAALVAETALAALDQGIDFYRLSREFFKATDETERVEFLRALFSVAASDGELSHDEIEEIRTIAQVLKLTHKQFIEAKIQTKR